MSTSTEFECLCVVRTTAAPASGLKDDGGDPERFSGSAPEERRARSAEHHRRYTTVSGGIEMSGADMTGADMTGADTTGSDATARRRVTALEGGVAAAGSVLLLASAALQQRHDIPRGDALGVLAYVDARPWTTAALLGVLGMLCWAAAVPGLARDLDAPVPQAVARLGGRALLVAVAVFAVEYAHDGYSTAALARQWVNDAPGAAAAAGDQRVVEVLVGGTSVLAQALVGLALAAFAVATLSDRRYPRVLSWAGAIGALGWFVTGTALFLDLPGSSFLLVLPFSTLSTAWLLVLGLVAVRRAWRPGPSRSDRLLNAER